MRWLLHVFMLSSVSFAADAHKFQSWRTLGQSSGVAHGEVLLEVEPIAGGALVRLVYIGLRDVACGGVTVMAWEKPVPRSLRNLVSPLDLCRIRRDLSALGKRHRSDMQGIEDDVDALLVRCGEREDVAFIPHGLTDLKEGSSDDKLLNSLWTLDTRIITAVWGQHSPDLSVIDADAELLGQNFVAQARKKGYANHDPTMLLDSFLNRYKGPLGRPTYEWRVETPPGVRITNWTEPRLFTSAFDVGIRASTTVLDLSVDVQSGKVKSSEAARSSNHSWVVGQVLWGDSMRWEFDPSTLPADGHVQVSVYFKANCGRGN